MNGAINRLLPAVDWFRPEQAKDMLVDGRGVVLEIPATRFGYPALGAMPAPLAVGRNSYRLSGWLNPWTVVGRYCSLSHKVDIGVPVVGGGGLCNTFEDRLLYAANPADAPLTIIGSDVWIGVGACVLQGARIGHGAVVGGCSVVTTDVPPYAVVAGNPARLIRYRFPPETIARLLASTWWMLPQDLVERLPRDDIETSLRIAEGYGRRRR